jgi:hypothetical protein
VLLEYVAGNVQRNQVGLKLNGTHRLLAYADDVNLPGDDISTVNKYTETLTEASKAVGLEINAEQGHDIKIANGSSENVAQFKHIETTVTNNNLIYEEIKSRLK